MPSEFLLSGGESESSGGTQSSMLLRETVADLGDLYLWPLDEARTSYAFIPKLPMVSRNADGAESVSLIQAGDMAFLSLTTEWTVADDRLEALRSDLESLVEAPVRLSFADVAHVVPELAIGGRAARPAASAPSMPPFNAMFTLQLDAEETADVQAALAGQEQVVWLRYRADLTLRSTTEVQVSGRLSDAPSRDALDQALQQGMVSISALDTDADLMGELLDQVLLRLMTTDRPDGDGQFSLTVSVSGKSAQPVVAVADLGDGRSAADLFGAVMPSSISIFKP